LKPAPKANIAIQIHAVARSRRPGRSTLRNRTRSPPVPPTAPPDLVLQHRSRRDGDGDRRIRVPHPVEPAEPLLCDLVRGSGMIKPLLLLRGRQVRTSHLANGGETVLLHRRRAGLLLSGDLLPRFRHDHNLRARIRSHAAEARPLDLHPVRRRGDDCSDCRRGFGGSGVFQPGGPDDTEQHSLGGACLPGVLVCHLPSCVVLDSGESQEESGFDQQEFCRCPGCRDAGRVLADLLSVGGDC
jgi:hypothetical protein